jgi:hypothetical protein
VVAVMPVGREETEEEAVPVEVRRRAVGEGGAVERALRLPPPAAPSPLLLAERVPSSREVEESVRVAEGQAEGVPAARREAVAPV